MKPPDPDRRRLLLLVALAGAAGMSGVLYRWLSIWNAEEEAVASSTPTVTGASLGTTTSAAAPADTQVDQEVAEGDSVAPTSTTRPPILEVGVICREAWGAQPAADGMQRHAIARLTVHHTAVSITEASGAPAQIRGHQDFHQQVRGWPDIAYHFLIDPAGHIYQGRDESFTGDTATDYDPTSHFLVAVDGNFDVDMPNESQLKALVDVLAYGAHIHGVDPGTIAGHRDFATTSCPGDNLQSLIETGWLEEEVGRRLVESNPTLRLICGADGAALVEGIERGET